LLGGFRKIIFSLTTWFFDLHFSHFSLKIRQNSLLLSTPTWLSGFLATL